MTELVPPSLVYCDATHLRRGTPACDGFLAQTFESAFDGVTIIPVTASNTLSMIFKQQVLLPLLALLHPRAQFLFIGFPPSPFFALCPRRAVFYVQDTFLLTRPSDNATFAHIVLALPFALAVRRLTRFFVSCEKTAADLSWYTRADARVRLFRTAVSERREDDATIDRINGTDAKPLKLVTLGRVGARMNVDAMLTAFRAVKTTVDTTAELHVVGAFDDRYANLTSVPGIVSHGDLSLAGLRRVFRSADIYLSTSHDEGQLLPLLEAQADGLVVLAPGKAVFREVLQTSGKYFDSLHPAEVATIIAALIRTDGWRRQAALEARENVRRWNDLAAIDMANARALFSSVEHPAPDAAGTTAQT